MEMKWEMKQSKWNKKKKKIIQRLLVWVVGLTGGWIKNKGIGFLKKKR